MMIGPYILAGVSILIFLLFFVDLALSKYWSAYQRRVWCSKGICRNYKEFPNLCTKINHIHVPHGKCNDCGHIGVIDGYDGLMNFKLTDCK